LDSVAFEDDNNLLDNFNLRSQVRDVFLKVLNLRSAETVVSNKGSVELNELVLPLGKVVGEGFDFVSEADDLAFESEDLVGSGGDLVVEGINLDIVLDLSFGFTGSFGIEGVSFVSEQVIDDFQN